jgi:hypothetical protein
MFAKKPAPPSSAQPRPTGWAVQALTADYIVNGYLPPTEMPLLGHLNVATQTTVTLSPAQVQPLRPQSTAVSETISEITLPKAALIAFIPRDEAGMRAAALQIPQRAERAIIYTGPYVIRAAFMLMGDMPLRNFFNTGGGNMVALTDADIACQLPGATFPTLKASIMILNKILIQLYHPAG